LAAVKSRTEPGPAEEGEEARKGREGGRDSQRSVGVGRKIELTISQINLRTETINPRTRQEMKFFAFT